MDAHDIPLDTLQPRPRLRVHPPQRSKAKAGVDERLRVQAAATAATAPRAPPPPMWPRPLGCRLRCYGGGGGGGGPAAAAGCSRSGRCGGLGGRCRPGVRFSLLKVWEGEGAGLGAKE